MILVDARTWVKAGIEFVDGTPRLAMVVTNDGFSDWSTACAVTCVDLSWLELT